MKPFNIIRSLVLAVVCCCGMSAINAQTTNYVKSEGTEGKFLGTKSELPGFPEYKQTGNPEQDAAAYRTAKEEYLRSNSQISATGDATTAGQPARLSASGNTQSAVSAKGTNPSPASTETEKAAWNQTHPAQMNAPHPIEVSKTIFNGLPAKSQEFILAHPSQYIVK